MSGAEIAGFLMAAPPLIEYIVKFASGIANKMEQNKSMRGSIPNLRAFTMEIGQIRLRQDMELGKRILKDPSVGQLDKQRLNEAFDHAVQTQRDLEFSVNTVLEREESLFSRKKRLALVKIGEQTRDLQLTLSNFHDMVISLTLIQASQSLLFLDDHDFAIIGPESNRQYLNSGAFITTGRLSKPTSRIPSLVQEYLFEAKSSKVQGQNSVRQDLKLLSQRLNSARLGGGILPLIGFRHEESKEEFHLVFQIDEHISKGQTLLKRLRLPPHRPSLNFRLSLCEDLAEAILHVHSLGLVHKNIRPDNIFLVPNDQGSDVKLFLLGWQYARENNDFQTRRLGEVLPGRRIYHHPHRQMQFAEHDYCMGHDIYSLGVCLFEILTWKPLLQYPEEESFIVSQEFKEMYKELGYADIERTRPARVISEEAKYTHWPLQVQQVLVALARSHLPTAAGNRMAGIVNGCLTCLDSEDGLGGGSGFQRPNRNEKEIGADFANAVLKDIRSINSAI